MKTLYKTRDVFTTVHSQSDYELKGYNHFGTKVIYMDVLPSAKMEATSLELLKELHTIKNLTFDEFDNGGEFHATVAMNTLKPFDFEQLWNYLQSKKLPYFKMKFDNIAVLKRDTDKWVVDRIWELAP